MCDLVLLATYVISWWCQLEHTTTTHTLQPLNNYIPSLKHHSSIVGPGTTSYVGYRQVSSSQIFHPLIEELSVMCDLVLLATYIISSWCHLEHTTTTHTLQPLNNCVPSSKHHSSIVGPGTTNCVGYRQNFILTDFSSSHRRVVNNVWPGTTSYIRYFLMMSLGTHNHNPHPPTTQQICTILKPPLINRWTWYY